MATNNNGNKTKLFSIIQKIKKKTMARDQERTPNWKEFTQQIRNQRITKKREKIELIQVE